MSDHEIEVTPEDALQVAQRALAKANEHDKRFDELEEELRDVREELTGLKLRLSKEDDRTYDSLSFDTKVGMVREHAFRKATNATGRAAIDYDDVRWEVFDGEPGNNQCYRLLRKAAGYNSDNERVEDVPGFDFDPNARPMRLTVDAGRAKRGHAFSARNNFAEQEGR